MDGEALKRLGKSLTLVLACLLLGSAFLGLALIPRPEFLLLAALAEGIGYGLFITTTVRLVASWSPHGQIATYQGLLNACSGGLAPLAAGLIGGAIFDASGPQTVFFASAGAAVVAIVVLLLAQLRGSFSNGPEQVRAAPPS